MYSGNNCRAILAENVAGNIARQHCSATLLGNIARQPCPALCNFSGPSKRTFRDKGGRYVGLTTFPPSRDDLM
jgi:hypothetical protein